VSSSGLVCWCDLEDLPDADAAGPVRLFGLDAGSVTRAPDGVVGRDTTPPSSAKGNALRREVVSAVGVLVMITFERTSHKQDTNQSVRRRLLASEVGG